MSIREIIDLSYRNKLGHLSSTLTAYPIIKEIYETKSEEDVFILSQGHAALALYIVLGRGQELLDRFGVHPHRSVRDGIHCSTGSLGMGITVALGMAMAGTTVHCLISDGECSEGSVWESLRLARNFPNLHVHVNFNGQSAYGLVDESLCEQLLVVLPTIRIHHADPIQWSGIESHYHVITDEEYETIIR